MVHNWPLMDDEPYGTCTWYSEGCAEYYSILLPVRFGLASREYLRDELQKRTDAYYTNPTRSKGNMEAAAICWEDRRAQKIAYGRGLFFLSETDAAIRRATIGGKSLDDVVLKLVEKSRNGEKCGNDAFISDVKAISGLDLSARLADMASGTPFAPPRDGFDGLLDYTEVETAEADTGVPCKSYKWFLKENT
jgi:predicted metalloprotease with PDZ domain